MRNNLILTFKVFFLIIFCLVFFSFVHADFTSTNFTLENPVPIIEGGQSSSPSFQYLSNTGQLTSGQSTSTSFAQNAGFMYFPTASSPIVTATSGNTSVSLSWTTSTGIFANVTSYDLGISTVSGGPYTFVSTGGLTNTTKTSLTNGVTYYFKVRTYAAGVLLSESAEVSAIPAAIIVTPPGGGGGGGGGSSNSTVVSFFGKAYPNSSIVILKDGQIAASTVAGSDANFNVNLLGLNPGSYIFAVYAMDENQVKSLTQSFPITVTTGANINVGGLFIAPTISADKSQVKKGDNITFFGQSVPTSEVTISVHSSPEIFTKASTDKSGVYLKVFDSSVLDYGSHLAKSKVALGAQISAYSGSLGFDVGDQNIAFQTNKCPLKGDINGDCKVNLVDFSIEAFWYKNKKTPPSNVDMNHDGVINLVDFSIMIHYWTG